MDHDAREHSRPQADNEHSPAEPDGIETPSAQAAIDFHARRLGRRFGLSEPDCDDARQELALALCRAMQKYDPSRASRATFRDRVLTLESLAIARKKRAFRRRDAKLAEALRVEARRLGNPTDADSSNAAIRAAMASISEQQRQICAGLLAGESVSGVARKLGIHRSTAHRELVAIRPAIRAALTESLD